MRNFLRWAFLLVIVQLAIGGCSRSSNIPDDSGASSTVAADALVYLQLGLNWESSEDSVSPEVWGTCSITNDETKEKDCEIKIPEARLYYSRLSFKVGTNVPDRCPILKFRPYYYQRSDDNGYDPPGETTAVDCSADRPTNLACYGGAAPYLEELKGKFPSSTGLYVLTGASSSSTYTLKSENTLRSYGGAPVNFLSTNNLDASLRSLAGDSLLFTERVPDAWQDYQILCTDRWGEELYTINLTLSDENVDGGLGDIDEDTYKDWD